MRWCRLYTETPSDPKLRRIAHQAGTSVSHTLAVWTSMLCHAAANEGDAWGTIAGWDDTDCAINLGIDAAVVFALRHEMEGRLLCGQTIIAWQNRQRMSDFAAARVKSWRENKRAQKQDVESDVTPQKRNAYADVTLRREEKRLEVSEATPLTCPVPDARTTLWTEGLARLRRITGKPDGPARGLLGKFCREARDDCALVSAILHEAESARPGEPLAWITAALKQRTGQSEGAQQSKLGWMLQ